MRPIQNLFLTLALVTPAMANGAPDRAAPIASEIRLSDEEKEKVLEAAATRKREQPATVAEEVVPQPPQVHGEVGFTIGTGGYRSAYGGAYVSLGDDGFAAISAETTDLGKRDRYVEPWWR